MQKQQQRFGGGFNQHQQQQHAQQQYKPGKTYVKHKPENQRSSTSNDDGEYIDYKEIKD